MSDDLYSATLPRPIPKQIRKLAILGGRPVPFFAKWHGPRPTTLVDLEAVRDCVEKRKCYICGARMGPVIAYHAQLSTGASRMVPEPGMCVECAEWYAMAFDPPQADPMLVWTSAEEYTVVRFDERGALLRIGDPLSIKAYCFNREATPAEVREAMIRTKPRLVAVGIEHGRGDEVAQRIADFEQTLARCGVGYVVLQ